MKYAEYRINLTYQPPVGAGHAEDELTPLEMELEAALDTWVQTFPQFGPVGSVDFKHRTIEIAFSLEAPSMYSALALARDYEDATWENGDSPRYPVVGMAVIPTALDN